MKHVLLFLFLSHFIYAQTLTGYGRNKIQYEDFEWNILRTEHLDVYYYPEMEDLAEKGAYFAEQSYKDVAALFNHTIRRRIPIIFYSTHIHFQQTNITPRFLPEGVGGFFEFIKGRVIIPGNGNMNQFRKVIQHEMVHVFMKGKIAWLRQQHGNLEGSNVPLWFSEGLADMYSAENDPNYDMIMKDALLNNYLPTLDNMYRLNGTFTLYKVGENILRYIRDEYGEQKVFQLIDNTWKAKKFSDVFYLTMGLTFEQFSRRWHLKMKKKYFPMLKDYDFAEAVTESVDPYTFNFKPSYYKNTNEILFWSNRTGYTSLYKRPLTSINEAAPDIYDVQNYVEHDAEMVLKGEASGDFESFHIFANKFDINDEDILAFTSQTQGTDALYLFDMKSKEVINKIRFENLVSITSPAWSPDMRSIVFSAIEAAGYSDIYVYDLESKSIKKLTNDFYDDKDPEWSPDGKYIVFSSDRGDKGNEWAYNIFRYDVENENIDYVSYGTHRDLVPSYSPDGKYIAYVSTRDHQRNIFVRPAQLGDSPEIPITTFASSVYDFEWINNDRMVFSAFNNNRFRFQSLPDIQNIIKNNRQKTDQLSLASKDATDSIASNDSITSLSLKPDHTTWSIPNLSDVDREKKERYSSDYDIDIAQSQVSQDPIFGTTGGVAIGITDMLGDDKYIVQVFNNGRTGDNFIDSFNFNVTKFSLGQRINYGYGAFRSAGLRFDLRGDTFEENEAGIHGIMQYPLNQFNRLELYTNFRYSDRDNPFFGGRFFSWVNTTTASYVRDNSIWNATGPIDGERLKVSIGFTQDFANNNISYFTFLVDLRKYFRITRRTSYAVRLMGLMNNGKQTRFYGMGGSWDLRGYKYLKVRGEKLLLLSQEYRFPLFDFFGFKVASGPALGSNRINGAFFVDAGNAYVSSVDLGDLRGSLGVGVRMNFLGALVLRWDVGKRTDFKSISPQTFMHFFFGWDF